MKKIAIMTCGGDVPGLNAAIRAVVKTALYHNIKTVAVKGGYEGLIDGHFEELTAVSVSNIIHRGGTIIKTSRSERFKDKKWRTTAFNNLKAQDIEAVILIGGNGSMKGAETFTSEFDIPFVCIPKTIDNDINGIDVAIGFDTATNTVLDALDKLRDTADSHHRLFFVEVMGREYGYIALQSGIAAAADIIIIPEMKMDMNDLIQKLEQGYQKNKSSMIVVVAEGAVKGGVIAIADEVKKRFDHFDIRVSILGHIQRGGTPSCFDRVLATRLGGEAVTALLKGKHNIMVGIKNNILYYSSLKEASAEKPRSVDAHLFMMAEEIAS